METYKAVFVDYLRKEMARRGKECEAAVMARLSVEDQQAFRALLPMAWISPQLGARILEAAGAVLFADHEDPIFELGRGQAHNDMTGIYRILMKVATVPMVIGRAATLFGTYHRKGAAAVEHQSGAANGVFLIKDYADLPAGIRRSVGGFITGLLELTGAKDIRVKSDESNPALWRWEIAWR
ncbi:MAG: hypothetical protein HY903_03050 [Deltaproteobacteria bacterium]|nr:hypothetical protein [Deltaproteobacteria bacterium]